MQKLKSCAGIGGLAIILWLGMLTAAGAATITVTTGAASGPGSLSNAVATAMSNSEDDTILFDPSVTTVTLTSTLVFNGADTTHSLTIDGGGTVTIDAGGVCKHLTASGGRTSFLILKGLTFINGNTGSILSDSAHSGSFMLTNCVFRYNSGATYTLFLASQSSAGCTTTVISCTFDHNTPSGGNGGGLSVYNMQSLIKNCTFSNNVNLMGGGIYIEATPSGKTAQIINCDFYTNCVSGNGSGGGGAGIFMQSNVGNVLIDHCAIRYNIATNSGYYGALYVPSQSAGCIVTVSNCVIEGSSGSARSGGCELDGNVTMVNCLVRGNATTFYGGGIHISSSTNVYLINCTITSNRCSNTGGGVCSEGTGLKYIYNCTIVTNTDASNNGGGVYAKANQDKLNIYSTIIAKNVGSSAPDMYCTNGVGIAVLDHCLIGTNKGYTVTTKTVTQENVDPQLSPLVDNGGPVLPGGEKLLTYAIGKTSLAYNKGSNPLGLAYDQRGSPYVREWPTGSPDIGAYEYSETVVSKGTVVLLR